VQPDGEVAVGVVDHAQGSEGGRFESGLLPQLPGRRRGGNLTGFDLAAREFPEAPQESGGGSPLHQPPTVPLQDDHRRLHVGWSGPALASGQRAGVVHLAGRPAARSDRTALARGDDRPADRLAELHDRLVERAPVGTRENLLEGGAQPGADRGPAYVPLLPGPAGGDSDAVCLERDHRHAEGEARDRPRDVRADPREALELLDRVGHHAGPVALDEAGGPVEVPGSCVVARARPGSEHLGLRRRRERGDAGEASDEPLEVRTSLGDARLLEEDLGHPDPVRVPILPPRERPTVLVEPGEEVAGETRREVAPIVRLRPSPHEPAPEEHRP
jgi:hypothetical protein